ncbi:LamG-like jellyroll fold domain-containing protein [Marinilabilia rubra]|uniref:LamG-like jellyroll fold domain-containing protein n=1 Tax=Marinilabilia rubra TaxID=2162893 RepID=A0A2U2B452_9BACT|nr:LamG-like jellyroll fold domain-containing protein [Marinilabilia rubra]PWD97851.1 hypothetical protein DDZ16_18475 [Marinilabilia rubra]
MKLRIITLTIFLYTFNIQVVPQSNEDSTSLIDISQPLLEVHPRNNIKQLINSEVRAFCPVPYPSGSGNSLNQIFQQLKDGIKAVDKGPVILINKHFDNNEWDNALEKSGLTKFLCIPADNKNLTHSNLSYLKKQIISLNKVASKFSFGKNEHLSNFSSSDSILSEEELKRDLLIVKLEESAKDTIRDVYFNNWIEQNAPDKKQEIIPLLKIWKTSGKRPHFLLTTPIKLNEAIKLSGILNKMPFYRAKALNNQKPYAPVFSGNNPDFRSGGRMSFPSPPGHRIIFSPRTRGLRFSPDILIFTRESQNREVTFRGFPLSLADDRVVWFHFNEEYAPSSPDVKKLIHPADSLMVKDSERGLAFQFNGQEDYLDCGSSLDIDFNQPISISAWIKPEKTDLNRGIAGMGRSFSFKIHEGQLTFTTADIKDHRLTNARIIPNQWQQVAVVFEPRMKISLYLNGRKMGSQQASDIQASDHSIIIGSNIWGEFFDGYIDDLMIWNRALSDEEVASLAKTDDHIINQETNSSKKPQLSLIYILLISVLAGLTLFWGIRKKSKKKQPIVGDKSSVKNDTSMDSTPGGDLIKLCTFGGFKIVTPNGKDLAARFSPKEKQLFIYLLWHSLKTLEKGVSSKQLSNDLWPGMSSARAKNNRSTYVQHLRQNLEETGISILYSSDRKWQVKLPPADHMFCDLAVYLKTINAFKNNPSQETLNPLTVLLKRGPFLKDSESEIIDHCKSEVENEIIQILTSDQTISIAVKSKSLISPLLNVIRQYDPLNEAALSLEIGWLTQNGHHGRALDAYKRFNRDYRNFYGEPFQKEMANFC